MALAKKILEVKRRIISNYGIGFHTVSKRLYEMKHEGNASKETHFGFETVKETEKAEKGMISIFLCNSNRIYRALAVNLCCNIGWGILYAMLV